jgi:hypothetical protein
MRAIVWAGLLLVGACGGGGQSNANKVNRDTLTERQQDSILAKSSIPGASAVDKAMKAADTTSSRVRGSDSVQ